MTPNAKIAKKRGRKEKKERKRARRRRRRRNGDVLADPTALDPGRRVTQVAAHDPSSSARLVFSHCNPCFCFFFSFFSFFSDEHIFSGIAIAVVVVGFFAVVVVVVFFVMFLDVNRVLET